MHFRQILHGRKSVASQKHGCWNSIEIVVLWRVTWSSIRRELKKVQLYDVILPFEHIQHALCDDKTTKDVDK